MRKGLFDGKIRFDDITIIDFKKLSQKEMFRRLELLKKKFK